MNLNLELSPGQLMRLRTILKDKIDNAITVHDPRSVHQRLAMNQRRDDKVLLEKIEGTLSRGHYITPIRRIG